MADPAGPAITSRSRSIIAKPHRERFQRDDGTFLSSGLVAHLNDPLLPLCTLKWTMCTSMPLFSSSDLRYEFG
jgi:hypothetical protein